MATELARTCLVCFLRTQFDEAPWTAEEHGAVALKQTGKWKTENNTTQRLVSKKMQQTLYGKQVGESFALPLQQTSVGPVQLRQTCC